VFTKLYIYTQEFSEAWKQLSIFSCNYSFERFNVKQRSREAGGEEEEEERIGPMAGEERGAVGARLCCDAWESKQGSRKAVPKSSRQERCCRRGRGGDQWLVRIVVASEAW
jgi:hypothetical protein